MSFCSDIGKRMTEGTNEARITCRGGKYCFSLSVPGFNQSSHLNFLTAAYNCEFAKLSLQVGKENNVFEVRPKLPIKNLELTISPLENRYLKCKYEKKVEINNLKMKPAIQVDTEKNFIVPSSKFSFKTDKIKVKGDVSVEFENLKLVPFKVISKIFLKSNNFAFGGRMINLPGMNATHFLLAGNAEFNNFKVLADFEPQTNEFTAVLKAKINEKINALIKVDNKDLHIFAVCKTDFSGCKYSGSVAVDTLFRGKVSMKFRTNEFMTAEITAAKSFTEEWPAKIGLFFNFNE